MSQSGLLDRSREAEWDRWYVEHLRIMETVDGIGFAQRFKTETPGHPPSLAMYAVASSDVFSDPYYLSIRGMGPWLPLIDRRYYRRNLFEGTDAPVVADDQRLWVADRAEPGLVPQGAAFTWLKCAGLDHSTPYRGIAVMPADAGAEEAARQAGVAVYTPFRP